MLLELRSGFEQFDIVPGVLRAIDEAGYREPTPIQRLVLPLMLEGQDVVGQSQTGTGKTAAFGIPIVSSVDPDLGSVQAIVLVPTRELCLQVAGELQKLGRGRGVRAVAVYGGQPIRVQLEALERGAQVVVGTPGRVLDHLYRGTLDLRDVALAVLDECDEMLDMGFIDDIDAILSHTPRGRQTALFSATLPPFALELIHQYMHEPEFLHVDPQKPTVDEIDQVYCEVLEDDKVRALRRLLRMQDPGARLLVFRRTQRGVDWLVRRLRAVGMRVEGLHGALGQPQRERVMGDFRSGKLPVLVATNVAARGLDISDVSHVLNYDLPQNAEEYVHRIGRTGRAGRRGTAVTFVGEWDGELFEEIRQRVGKNLRPLDLKLYGEQN
ncbi:MAG TPA: DEAD/DEAH box helicase [Chloroflexota bacterium]|jgi:ATP-dependent RNA helicase DeaD|nr:DEAD/DEAH box helicase [Chloroflexota bacterium]